MKSTPHLHRKVRRLVNSCMELNEQLLIGIDANAHNLVWGSKDTNSRGEYLLEFLVESNLEILNRGQEPTFRNAVREDVIDITVGTMAMGDYVKLWHVTREHSISDHRYIKFEIEMGIKQTITYRNPRKTDWDSYKRDLNTYLNETKSSLRNTVDIEDVADQLTTAIMTSYQDNCTISRKTLKRNVPWWNTTLEKQRRQVRRLFNSARGTGHWATYREALVKYNIAIKLAEAKSWKKFCEDVEGVTERARLQKVLTKIPMNPGGTLRKEGGGCKGNLGSSPEDPLSRKNCQE